MSDTSPAFQLRQKARALRAVLGSLPSPSKSSIAAGLLLIALCALSVYALRLSRQLQAAETSLKEVTAQLEAARKREAADGDGRAELVRVVAQANDLLEDIDHDIREVDAAISDIDSSNSQVDIGDLRGIGGNADRRRGQIRSAAFDASLALSRIRGALSAWNYFHAKDVAAPRFSPDL